MNKYTLLFLIIFINCFSNTEEKVQKVFSDRTLSDQIAILKISELVWGKTLKNIEVKQEENGFLLVTDFGGSSALTFLEQKNYADTLKLDMAKYIFRVGRYGQGRGLSSVRASLVKPLYVKDAMRSEESVEEFEIFRIFVSINDLKKIKNWEQINPFAETRQGIPVPEVVNVLKEITQIWQVELDEFRRIKVK